MANIKISQLTSLSTMTDAAIIPVVASGSTQQISGANLKTYFGSYGNANVAANLAAFGSNPITTTGTITAGNLDAVNLVINRISSDDSSFVTIEDGMNVAGEIAATGNITGGNLAISTITATGNITFAGDSSSAPTLNNFNVNAVSITATAGNLAVINGGAAGLSGGYISATRDISATGNVIAGNITTAGLISATGNITGGNILGNGRALTSILFSSTSDATAAGLTVDNFYLSASTALSVTNSGSLYYLFDQYSGNNPTIYAVAGSTLAFRLAVTGHPFLIQSSGANYSIGLNHVTTAGTVTTAASAQGQVTGTLYWKIPSNAVGTYTYQCSVHGGMVGNIVVSSPTEGSFASLSVTGNVSGGNITTAGLISATGNISGGNLNVTGNIVDTGALTIITGSNGNIALAPNGTGIVTASGVFSATGNVTGGNLLTAGLISATGNITGGNLNTGAQVVATGNITGGNLITAGLVSATGNVSGGNIITTGNVTGNTAGFAIGYRDIPQVSLASNVTTALTDAGKHYYSTSASNLSLTIANNTSVSWPVGTAISVVNRGTANITIAQGTGVSLYLAGNATSGNRTVTTYGMATVMNVAANIWMINGTVV